MKATINALAWRLIMPIMLVCWLYMGLDGYGNLFKAYVVLQLPLAILRLTDKWHKEMAADPEWQPRFIELSRYLNASGLLVLCWFGHFWLAGAFGWTWMSAEYCRDHVLKLRAKAPEKPAAPDMADAYAGAREDLEDWKRRALAAEATLRANGL